MANTLVGNLKGPPGTIGVDGAPGNPAYTLSVADFTVPAIGASVVVTVQKTDWAAVNEWVYVDDIATTTTVLLQIINKTANTLTLLNPTPTGIIVGPPGQDGTDGVDGTNGVDGNDAYTLTSLDYVVPPIGQTADLTVDDPSWIVNGEFVYLQDAAGPGQALPLQVQNINGNVVTLLNPVTSTPSVSPVQSFQTLTAATNLTAADSNKYLICSGGSWVLGLPTPVAGLTYRVRNDMGIQGVTGTITITPASGTIDGLASLALLPGQECHIITNGIGWRTIGRQRYVLIGTMDVSAVGSFVILLPLGYRYFHIEADQLAASTGNPVLVGVVSTNGGSTWQNANYFYCLFYNNTSTTMAAQLSTTATYFILGPNLSSGPVVDTAVDLYPGVPGSYCTMKTVGGPGFTGSFMTMYILTQYLNVATGPVNALSIFLSGPGTFSGRFNVFGAV